MKYISQQSKSNVLHPSGKGTLELSPADIILVASLLSDPGLRLYVLIDVNEVGEATPTDFTFPIGDCGVTPEISLMTQLKSYVHYALYDASGAVQVPAGISDCLSVISSIRSVV